MMNRILGDHLGDKLKLFLACVGVAIVLVGLGWWLTTSLAAAIPSIPWGMIGIGAAVIAILSLLWIFRGHAGKIGKWPFGKILKWALAVFVIGFIGLTIYRWTEYELHRPVEKEIVLLREPIIPGVNSEGTSTFTLTPSDTATIKIPPMHRWDPIGEVPSGWNIIKRSDEGSTLVRTLYVVPPTLKAVVTVRIKRCETMTECQ